MSVHEFVLVRDGMVLSVGWVYVLFRQVFIGWLHGGCSMWLTEPNQVCPLKISASVSSFILETLRCSNNNSDSVSVRIWHVFGPGLCQNDQQDHEMEVYNLGLPL